MRVAERVARRFTSAKDWTWADVEKELKQLQTSDRLAKGRIDERTAKKLSEMKTFDMLPHAFGEWLKLGFNESDKAALWDFAGDVKYKWQRVSWAYERLGNEEKKREPDPTIINEERKELEERIPAAKKATDVYIAEVTFLVGQATPARLTYQGFKIENLDRMPEPTLKLAFDKIDLLVAFFKRRGMLKLLQETINTLELSMRSHDAAGNYYSQRKSIGVYRSGLFDQSGRLLTDWIKEVFIHEIGHHIHHYLHPDAWAVWGAPWKGVKEKKKLRDTLSGKDRERFYKLLEAGGFNPVTTARKLKGLDKIKFAQWLRKPGTGESLITPKTFRPSKRGKDMFIFLRDPEAYTRAKLDIPEGDDEYVLGQYAGRLKRTLSWVLFLGDGPDMAIPLDPDIVEEVKKIDPSVEKAIDALEGPSGYSKKDEREDFAETFVLFMVDPNKLSDTAKFRMQQALAISGLYGKPVGRHAAIVRRVARRAT